MKVTFKGKRKVLVGDMTFHDWQTFMSEFMSQNPNAGKAWDVMGCVRGPDSPSEYSGMPKTEYEKAYDGRRNRKYKTVEVLRAAMFLGTIGGCARHHHDTKVIISGLNDHFDRHVISGARALGIQVEEEEKGEEEKKEEEKE